MPSSLRSRVALVGLLGIFLIPIGLSSLSGFRHVITCQQRTRAPFTLDIPDQGPPTVLSALTLQRGGNAELCGGLTLDMAVRPSSPGKVAIILPITNHTRYAWRGSVKLVVGHTSVPVGIGEIRAGATRSGTVDVRVDPGIHVVGGSLLIGP